MVLATTALGILLTIPSATGYASHENSDLAPAASKGAFEVDRWTIADGLPQGQVTSLASDGEGGLWIGTFGGVVRFNGISFEPLSAEQQNILVNNRITALLMARDGTLWIGTASNGLFTLFEGELRKVPTMRGRPEAIHRIMEDSLGRKWIAFTSVVGTIANGPFKQLDQQMLLPTSFVEDRKGNIWITAQDGLFVFSNGSISNVSTKAYSSLSSASDGTIWAALRGAPEIEEWRADVREPVAHRIPEAVTQLHVARNGDLWLAGRRIMVRRSDRVIDAFRTVSYSNDSTRIIYDDAEGSIWFGSTIGLVRIRRGPLVGYPHVDPGFRSLFVIPQDRGGYEGRLLVVSYYGEVYAFDGEWRRRSGFGPVSTIAAGRDGSVIVASSKHPLSRLVGDTLTPLVPSGTASIASSETRVALESTDGTIWLGKKDGRLVQVRSDGTGEVLFDRRIPFGEIQVLHETSTGELWVGSVGGLAHVRDGKIVRRWASGHDILGGDFRAIYEHPDGGVWVGTYASGLFVLDPDGEFLQITTKHGLHENVVSGIHADDYGHVVLLGNRAVSRVAYEDLVAVAQRQLARLDVQVFSKGPGITFFEGNGGRMNAGWKQSDGVMWFPTQEGVARFDPAVLKDDLPAPTVRITSLKVNGRDWALDEQISIPPSQPDLVFRFTSGTLVDSERAQFRYRLSGYDKDWVFGGTSRDAIYTHVPPGRYTFSVLSANRDGVWSERPDSIAVHVEARLYETAWFRVLAVLILVAFAAFAFVYRSVLARRRAEELENEVARRTAELNEARETLEERVEERTEQLRQDLLKRERLEQQLRDAQRMESIGRLAGGLAHDFNNYLTVVMSSCELVQVTLPTRFEEEHELVGEVMTASRHAAELTQQLLAYSRQQILEPQVVDVNEKIRSLYVMLRRLVREEIDIELDLSARSLPVLVDPGQFEQVIVNLIVNAGHASDGIGQITVRTSLRNADSVAREKLSDVEAEDYVFISVADCGHGMTQETVDRIFEPFFTTKEFGKGTGLGLASVSGIVKQSGGHIEVSSELGQGSVFNVYFPLVEDVGVEQDSLRPSIPPVTATARVFVCEDQENVGELIASMLTSLGHDTVLFHDAEELLEVARASNVNVDILVTDVVMPGMSGPQLASEFALLHPDACILFVSGYSPEEDFSGGLDEHRAFLQKPFGREALAKKMAELLEAAPRSGQDPSRAIVPVSHELDQVS